MSREDDLYNKAVNFAVEETEKQGLGWIQPSGRNSGLERYEGEEYAVLRDSDEEVSGVIRIDGDDRFTILDPEDWPEELLPNNDDESDEDE
jgi:hypothetical protein